MDTPSPSLQKDPFSLVFLYLLLHPGFLELSKGMYSVTNTFYDVIHLFVEQEHGEVMS